MPTAVEGVLGAGKSSAGTHPEVPHGVTGGFSLGDNPCESPPRCADSYIVDTMKDLHQLPWLERFVSVISDTYNHDYIQ
jgi:hypothetical protein